MGSEWQTEKLGDFIEIQTGFPFQSAHYSEEPGGIRLLRGDNLIQGTFRWDNVKKWPPEQVIEKHRSYELSEGDVVLAMDRPWIEAGLKTAQVKKTDLPCLLVQRVARLRSRSGLSQDFLRYLISSYGFTEYVKQIQTGTAVPHISAKQIQSYVFSKPSFETQERIGSILRSLDDKIELNREMNATLESMAQALFKSWFVDFDPVIDNALAAGNPIPDELADRAERRAKAAQQPSPELPQTAPTAIRQQFPDRFVFIDTMGWVPEGWEVVSLDDIVELIGGGTPKTTMEEYWGGDIPWFSVVDAPSKSDVFVLNTEKNITKLGLENSSTKLLPEGTTIISARGTVGKCALVGKAMAMNQSCYGVRGKDGIADYFVYYTILLRVSDLQQRGHGSVFNTITRDTFKSILTPRCPVSLTTTFHTQVADGLSRIRANNQQIGCLTQLRDTLLPKLLSGQLRIPEAEQLLAEAL